MARFLVVDDDPAVGRNLARLVRPFGESVVAGSVSGAMALLAAQVAWQGFFVDLGLPDGSGLDVLAMARASFPRVRAMVLTGSVQADLINAVHDLGAHYVVKPVDGARIERFCREIATAGPSFREAPPEGSLGVEHLPPTLDDYIARLRQLLILRPAPQVRYSLGAIISEIKANPGAYGKNAVATVATALGEDLPGLYRHAAVAECWTEAEVRALLERRGGDGRSLTWSHLLLLGSVASARVRASLIEQALSEALSVRHLAALAREQAGES